MNIFTFFSILEKRVEIKSINYSDTVIVVYLLDFSKIILPLKSEKLQSKYFSILYTGEKTKEFLQFLQIFVNLEKSLDFSQKDFEDYHTSLKIDYKIFHTIGETFVIEFPDCNNRCYFCETHSQSRIRKGFSFENIVLAYEFFEKKGNITTIDFFGGEPTIHKDFFKFVEYFGSKGHTLYLATHGRKFTDKDFIEKIRDRFHEIRISFHSIDKQSFEKVTLVKRSFDETLEGIKNLYDAKFDNVVINTVLTHHNWNEITTTIKELHKIHPLLTFKISGLIFSKNETYQDIHETYPGLEKMHALIHNEIIPVFDELKVKNYEFEKVPLCLLGNKVKESSYLPETYRNQKYDDICRQCPKKEVCTILPQIQLDYINKNQREKIFFTELRKNFIQANT